MKVLFVAVFSPTSTNTPQADGFERNGHEVIRFNFRVIASQIGWDATCDMLIQQCEEHRPDFVVFSKCHEIQLRAWGAIKALGIRIAYWFMDPMSNYSSDIQERVCQSDIAFFALWDPYQHGLSVNPNSHFLQEGYDHTCNFPIEGISYTNNVTFIGNLRSQKRMDYYNQVGFTLVQSAYGLEHSKAVCSTKINLNFTEGGCSDRVYKVLASGGFLLTDPWPHMEDDFEPNVDFAIFNSSQELKEKIQHYLLHENERFAIAKNGHQKVQKFSRIHWAKVIADEVDKIIDDNR
jgi:hypothetical protein